MKIITVITRWRIPPELLNDLLVNWRTLAGEECSGFRDATLHYSYDNAGGLRAEHHVIISKWDKRSDWDDWNRKECPIKQKFAQYALGDRELLSSVH